jgi:hypothetical protein
MASLSVAHIILVFGHTIPGTQKKRMKDCKNRVNERKNLVLLHSVQESSLQTRGKFAMTDDSSPRFLEHVRIVIGSEEPSADSLYKLLKMASPSLAKIDLMTESSRSGAISQLLHDINTYGEANGDTCELIESVQAFVNGYCNHLASSNHVTRKRKAIPITPSSSSHRSRIYPDDFHVQDKWKFLDINMIQPQLSASVDNDLVGGLVAVHCINARGAIAHGLMPGNFYELHQVKDRDVERIFDRLGGGVKYLRSPNAIKEELMEHGPVVSVSFIPDRACVSAVGVHPASLIKSGAETKHELLIVGWQRKDYMPCWLVKRPSPHNHDRPIEIAMRNFGIDDLCLAPTRSFQDVPWQSGPYFDVPHLPKGWMQFPSLTLHINCADLKTLEGILDERMMVTIDEERRIVVRDKHRLAHSRRFCPRLLDWIAEEQLWSLTLIRAC